MKNGSSTRSRVSQSPKIPVPVRVKGIGEAAHLSTNDALPTFYIPEHDGTAVAVIEAEFHLVMDLPAKMLIGVDIMEPYGWIVDFLAKQVNISKCGVITNIRRRISLLIDASRFNNDALYHHAHRN